MRIVDEQWLGRAIEGVTGPLAPDQRQALIALFKESFFGSALAPGFSDQLLHTEAAQAAYRNSPLFHCVIDALRANEDRMNPVSLLGLLLAQVCEAREEWIEAAVRKIKRIGADRTLLDEAVAGCRCRFFAWTETPCPVHGWRAGR